MSDFGLRPPTAPSGSDTVGVYPVQPFPVSILSIAGLTFPISLPADVTGSGSMGSLNAVAQFGPLAAGTATVAVTLGGTWVGTVSFQYTGNAATFYAAHAFPQSDAVGVGSAVSTNGLWFIPCAGCTHVRCAMTAYTSGTASVAFNSSIAAYTLQ